MAEKLLCPGCKQLVEHDRGFLPMHAMDLQRGQLVTGSKICDYSNKKVLTEKRKVTYAHDCEVCGVQTEISVEEDYPGAFTDGIKPFIEINCMGCSTDHDGYYCSNNGCGLEVAEHTTPFFRVLEIGGQPLPVQVAKGDDQPRFADFDTEVEAQTFHDSLPEGDYSVDQMDPGWYGVRRGESECRSAVLDPKAMLLAGGGSGHVGAFKAKHEHKVLVTDGHLIREEPDEGEVVEPDEPTLSSDTVLVCDCCHLRRDELPYHHDAHDTSGRSWDYCQECEDAGCDLIDCSVRANQRSGRAHA